jgi:hypothetical protein
MKRFTSIEGFEKCGRVKHIVGTRKPTYIEGIG